MLRLNDDEVVSRFRVASARDADVPLNWNVETSLLPFLLRNRRMASLVSSGLLVLTTCL